MLDWFLVEILFLIHCFHCCIKRHFLSTSNTKNKASKVYIIYILTEINKARDDALVYKKPSGFFCTVLFYLLFNYLFVCLLLKGNFFFYSYLFFFNMVLELVTHLEFWLRPHIVFYSWCWLNFFRFLVYKQTNTKNKELKEKKWTTPELNRGPLTC